nr:MAG TPA: hypothetical protein [Caudoviricetes sp.]
MSEVRNDKSDTKMKVLFVILPVILPVICLLIKLKLI